MDEERLRRISTLVDSTFDLSLKELRSFLDRECPDDPELRAEVERRVLDRSTITGLPIPGVRRASHPPWQRARSSRSAIASPG